jgi:dynein heavy chain 1
MLAEMYGGKIDDEEDFATLQSLVNNFMTPAAFEADHNIIRGLRPADDTSEAGALILPEGTTWEEFRAWVQALPEREPPTYLGLPGNAEKLLLVGQAKNMMADLRLIVGILDE